VTQHDVPAARSRGAATRSGEPRTPPRSGDPALERLRRWEDAGGTWQVVRRSTDAVTVSLCRCDGGEEADRFTSDDAELIAHLAGRESSDPV